MEKFNELLGMLSLNETVLKIILTVGIMYIVSIIKSQLSKFINEKN